MMKSRKLWGAILLIVIALTAVFTGKAQDFMIVSPFIMQIFGLYVIGNVGSKITKK